MICDTCRERDAVVHLTQVVEGAVTQVHLCEKCAADKGVETTVAAPKTPLTSLLQTVQQQMATSSSDQARCAFCQATYKDFRASGRLGCARCYSTFETQLRDLLQRVHGGTRHAGRQYGPPAPDQLQRASTVLELREQLRRAIELEQFEQAARLRDQLKEVTE
ncbi:MAG TPA: UvrB/UvrC motif-containing protein [Gemmatimonadaceae bacterium]|nr:UvrB/UvrC motif-containing protein [Gemmatimonadaceae bacterium]